MRLMSFAAIATVLLAACEPTPVQISYGHYCDADEGVVAARFVVECADAANPMSDEEGEDLVMACRDTARELLCSSRPQWTRGGYDWHWCHLEPNDACPKEF